MALLSETCVFVLQSATAAACVEALNAAPPSELWTLVLAVVNPVIRAHAQMHMERVSCIAKMPDELLVSIFEHLDFGDRIRTATVCHRWRTVSLAAVPALWSDIPNLRNMHTYESLLARARDLPVSVTYVPEGLQDLETFGDIILQNIDRIKGIRFVFPHVDHEEDSRDAAAYLDCFLSQRASILESIFLSDPDDIISRAYPSLPILKSPMLRSIELQGFDPSYLEACADSQALRTLEMSTSAAYETLHRDHWSYLTRLPALESLALDLPDVVAVDIPPHGHSLALSLQYFRLEVHPLVLDALVTVEDLSRFQTLDISFLYQSAEIEWLAERLPFLRNATVSAAVSSNASSLFLTAADSSGRKSILQGLKLDENWHTLLPNVQKLCLDPYFRNPHSGTASAIFRALEQLTLDVTVFALAIYSSNPRPLALPTFLCPRLRSVHFISRNKRRQLPADMVLSFLRRTLASSKMSPRRLDRLAFDRVTVDPAPNQPDIAAALLTVARNVEMVDSGEVPPESMIHFLHQSWKNP